MQTPDDVLLPVTLPNQNLHVNFINQIQYQFENRLSDKFYVTLFIHVVIRFRKKNYHPFFLAHCAFFTFLPP